MIHKYIQPSPHLKTYILEYWLLHFTFDASALPPMKPYPATPEQGIRFFTRGLVWSKNLESGTSIKVPPTHIFGQHIARQNQLLPPEMLMLEITFQPGALYKFLCIPLTEFTDKNMDAELVLGKEIREVSEQLANAPSYAAMFPIVENWLWKKIQGLNYHFRDMDSVGKQTMDTPAFLMWIKQRIKLFQVLASLNGFF